MMMIGDVFELNCVPSASWNFMVALPSRSFSPIFLIPVVAICSTSVAVSPGVTLTLQDKRYLLSRLFV